MGLLDRLRQLRSAASPTTTSTGRTQALVVHGNEFGFDPFGLSRDTLRSAASVARWLYRHYFRAEAFGIENIPADRPRAARREPLGPAAVRRPRHRRARASSSRRSRASCARWSSTSCRRVPFASYLFARWGQITGTPENCRRLLAAEEAVLVFPEGARGISKPFSQRYQLAEFGKGFMRLALETQARRSSRSR